MKIKNINGYSHEDLQHEAGKGAKFVRFAYTVSMILVTFKRESGIYIIKAGEKTIKKSLSYTLVTFLFGWWGIPSGPKRTIQSIRTNLGGGIDVTDEISATIDGHLLFKELQQGKKLQMGTGTPEKIEVTEAS